MLQSTIENIFKHRVYVQQDIHKRDKFHRNFGLFNMSTKKKQQINELKAESRTCCVYYEFRAWSAKGDDEYITSDFRVYTIQRNRVPKFIEEMKHEFARTFGLNHKDCHIDYIKTYDQIDQDAILIEGDEKCKKIIKNLQDWETENQPIRFLEISSDCDVDHFSSITMKFTFA